MMRLLIQQRINIQLQWDIVEITAFEILYTCLIYQNIFTRLSLDSFRTT